MRFICPSCETEYDIPDGKVRNALKLRCNVCGCVSKIPVAVQNEESEQEDVSPETQTNSVDPYIEDFIEGDFSAFIPVKKQKEDFEPPLPNDFFAPPEDAFPFQDNAKRNMRTALMLLACSIVLLFVSALVKIYGKAPPPPVGFENVTYYFTEEDYKRFLIITGTLVNKTKENVSVPAFSVRFFNKTNVMLAKQKIPTVLPLITPESALPFSLRIERPPSSAEKVELSPQNISVAPADKVQTAKAEKETKNTDSDKKATPSKANPSAKPESRPTSGNGG